MKPLTECKERGEMEFITERRRHQRTHIGIPVTLYPTEGVIEGVTVNESYTGILMQVLDGSLPARGEKCRVILRVLGEKVEALGVVVRLEEEENQVAVELTQLGQNGVLLLALFPPL